MAVRAVTGVLQGLATGNQNAAWVNGLSPYANNLIKTYTTDESGEVNQSANLMAHAVLGALEAYATDNHAAAGAAGAVTAEAVAHLITEQLYHTDPDNLTDDQKQVVATLSQVTAGLAGVVIADSTQSAVSAAEIGRRAVENNYLFPQEAEEKAVLERKVSLGTATEEEESRLAQINLIDQIRDNEIMAACSQGVSSDSCQALVQDANYAQYGYEQNLAYNLKFKELYRQDYENVVNILRGKDKDSVDFEKIALSISKSQNISLAEAKSFLSKVMVYKEFAELVGMVRAGTAVKYGVKSDNFATQVPDEMSANSKLPVVGPTKGYENQISILFDELTQKGIKYSADKVVSINKLSNGKIIFLEQGNSNSGLQHIIERHGSDFLSIGIKNEQIPNILMKALSENKIVGYQGKGIGRPIYEVQFNNKKVYIAITTGNNGYIVGANPTRVKEVK